MNPNPVQLLHDPQTLAEAVARALNEDRWNSTTFPSGVSGSATTSSVLFLLGNHCGRNRGLDETCVVFNKRSRKVRQPGDLCFPGGSMAPKLDPLIGRLLSLPGFPLARWPYWRDWRRTRSREARRLSLLLATGLREGFEEMRLNPLGVRVLGPLPAQNLTLFRRVIYPMVGWIHRQTHFLPNWEVERIVYVPLRFLLDPGRYARYRLRFEGDGKGGKDHADELRDFPCFIHHGRRGREMLWGATYRIVTVFLERVFSFRPPEIETLPIVHGVLNREYLDGQRQGRRPDDGQNERRGGPDPGERGA